MKAKIPKNIRKYKKTLILNFDARQCITILLALVLGGVFYKGIGKMGVSIDLQIMITSVVSAFIIMIGFYQHLGMYAEKILVNMLLDMLCNVNFRPYKMRGINGEKD